jgi:lactonase
MQRRTTFQCRFKEENMKDRIVRAAFFALLAAGFIGLTAQQSMAAGLAYDKLTQGPTPIPAPERGLQTAEAEQWFKVTDADHILEGAIFDAKGNLLFCDVSGHRVMRLTPDRKLSIVVTLDGYSPGGLSFHKDGRLFIAGLNENYTRGIIAAVNSDGSGLQTIIGPEAGYLPNDLVFDVHGGFYFTDFKGTATEPTGGVYYVLPDFTKVTPVILRLAKANGVALAPDGKVLWVTEFGRNLLHRAELADSTTVIPIGSAIPYHFIGTAPDSMRCDADGNVYVAVYSQGRVQAFNKIGIPIGQILLPGRDQGWNLRSTSLAIRPDSRELYAVTSDETGTQGSLIFRSEAFAQGLRPASQQ